MVTWKVRIADPKASKEQLKRDPRCEFSTEEGRCSRPATQALTVSVRNPGSTHALLLERIYVLFSLCERHASAEGAIGAYKDGLRRADERAKAGEKVDINWDEVSVEAVHPSRLGPELGG